MNEFIEFLKTLPLESAIVAWDAYNHHVTENTLALAEWALHEGKQCYEFNAAVAGSNLQALDWIADYAMQLINELQNLDVVPFAGGVD